MSRKDILESGAKIKQAYEAEADTNAFTDDEKAKLAAYPTLPALQSIILAASDETTDLTTGTNKIKFRMPYAFSLTAVKASLNDPAVGATLLTVDVNEGGVSIFGTNKLTFDANEKTTITATTPADLVDVTLAADSEISVDIDSVGNSAAGKGLKVSLIGRPA